MDIEVYAMAVLYLLIVFLALGILIVVNTKAQQHIKDDLTREFTDYIRKMMDELNDANKAFVQNIIDSNKSLQMNYERKPTKDLFATFVKLRNSIKDNCTQAMNKIGAERIAIYLFHNGNQSTHGIKFFKISCICEKVNIGSGVREQALDQSNIPINLFDDTINNLIDNGRCIIINDDNIANSNNKIFISAKKIKYAQAISIFDNENNILGFVLIELSHEYDKNNADMEKYEVDRLIAQLVPILAYSDYTQAAIKPE